MIRAKNVAPYVFMLDLDEEILYDKIKRGEDVTSNGNHHIANALTRLRRNRLIVNTGSRSKPNWRVTGYIPNEHHFRVIGMEK